MTGGTILLVEDDQAVRDLVQLVLKKEKYHVQSVATIAEAKSQLQKTQPDLVILDRMLPDGDGIEVCNFLRGQETTAHIPILFLSEKRDVAERVAGLKVGGDDYLPKPCDSAELLARVEALLRRSQKKEEPRKILQVGPLRLDLTTHECFVENKPVDLRRKEFELLQLFLQSKKRVLRKDFLSERIWESEYLTSSRAIDTAIQRLRQKLGEHGDSIETVRGYGFRFNEDKL